MTEQQVIVRRMMRLTRAVRLRGYGTVQTNRYRRFLIARADAIGFAIPAGCFTS